MTPSYPIVPDGLDEALRTPVINAKKVLACIYQHDSGEVDEGTYKQVICDILQQHRERVRQFVNSVPLREEADARATINLLVNFCRKQVRACRLFLRLRYHYDAENARFLDVVPPSLVKLRDTRSPDALAEAHVSVGHYAMLGDLREMVEAGKEVHNAYGLHFFTLLAGFHMYQGVLEDMQDAHRKARKGGTRCQVYRAMEQAYCRYWLIGEVIEIFILAYLGRGQRYVGVVLLGAWFDANIKTHLAHAGRPNTRLDILLRRHQTTKRDEMFYRAIDIAEAIQKTGEPLRKLRSLPGRAGYETAKLLAPTGDSHDIAEFLPSLTECVEESALRHVMLQEALAKESPEMQATLILKAEGYTDEQIAQVQGVTVPAIKQRLRRFRRRQEAA